MSATSLPSIDHLAKPPVATGDDGTWERNLRALAGLPQVSVKLSGMPPELGDDQEWVFGSSPMARGRARCVRRSTGDGGQRLAGFVDVARRLSPGRWLSMVLDDLAASPAAFHAVPRNAPAGAPAHQLDARLKSDAKPDRPAPGALA